ncbi:hypothetical protein LOK49_LG04G02819 [Camellia lanceoleosa]|uniref:Uncharacterized protein n=1 Tax=Camellia lanceoleosa TaxID=1840588 RepID=A0ACC0I3J3_9ERIC|nr:hypothetical protein LOK49_LG04G02819 [Camellia lanceoleosa]
MTNFVLGNHGFKLWRGSRSTRHSQEAIQRVFPSFSSSVEDCIKNSNRSLAVLRTEATTSSQRTHYLRSLLDLLAELPSPSSSPPTLLSSLDMTSSPLFTSPPSATTSFLSGYPSRISGISPPVPFCPRYCRNLTSGISPPDLLNSVQKYINQCFKDFHSKNKQLKLDQKLFEELSKELELKEKQLEERSKKIDLKEKQFDNALHSHVQS